MRWLGKHFPILADVWSPRKQVLMERRLWLVVMEEQARLGFFIPSGALSDYRQASEGPVLFERLRERELVTRHDVKARLEEFNYQAGGYEYAHLGMTSADVVDNISLVKIRDSLAVLTHRWPNPFESLRGVASDLPFRGIKGAIGTMADQIELLGSTEKAQELDRRVADRMGFPNLMTNVGQIYYRSLDLQIASEVVSLALMVEHHWAHHLLLGYQAMITDYAGNTWNEGDVSTSVVRRVALPGLFLSAAAVAARIGPPRFLDPVW